eukprot:SAG11_NODE_732_length_7469_cov_4.333107_2_plen_64_part_00
MQYAHELHTAESHRITLLIMGAMDAAATVMVSVGGATDAAMAFVCAVRHRILSEPEAESSRSR